MTDYIYHIYDNGSCIHSSLTEEEFNKIWKSLDLSNTQYEFEKLFPNKEVALNSSY